MHSSKNLPESDTMERKSPQRRTKTKIVLLILKASSTGITKAALRQSLGQNHLGITNYLNELMEKGLIEIATSNPKISVCTITEKGQEALKLLEEVERRFGL
jgi:predicted transcriptional regulator